jgi:hypothetical protein
MKKILSALVFSLVVVGFAPATAATVSRLDSAPGQSQSDWEATDAYKAFTCPEGTLRGGGVDLNFTTDRSDDKYFVTCDEPSPTAADDADFSKRTREATAAAEIESIAYSAANPGKQKCVQWGPVVHKNGISTSSGGVCANIVGVASTSETSTVSSPSVSETITASASTPTPETTTPIFTPRPTVTPAPSSEPRGLGGYAIIHPDGHVCGVIVGNSYFGNNDRTMTSEYMGCPVGSPIIFQTKPSPTGNVAGWHGSNVTYSSGVFTITNSDQVAMTISDGIATDSTGRMWDTGSGVTLRAATVITPTLPSQGDTATVSTTPSTGSSNTAPSAPTSESSTTSSDTRTVTSPQETITALVAVAIPAPDEDLSTLDEIFPEEEVIDSIEAVVQSNGTTRIQVSTGYNLTGLTVVASKKGLKKKYTYKITTNAEGERKFKSGLNLRGFTVVLYKGSTELDRMYIS